MGGGPVEVLWNEALAMGGRTGICARRTSVSASGPVGCVSSEAVSDRELPRLQGAAASTKHASSSCQ